MSDNNKNSRMTAMLFAVVLLLIGEAHAQTTSHAQTTYKAYFYDVTEAYKSAPVGTYPLRLGSPSLGCNRGNNFASDDGVLMLNEGKFRTYEFFFVANQNSNSNSNSSRNPSCNPKARETVRIELVGEGKNAYRLSGGDASMGKPIIPPEPSTSAITFTTSSITFTLSGDSDVGDLIRIRALQDDDIDPPPPATLRISPVSGENPTLTLELELSTVDDDTVDINVGLHAERDDDAPRAALQFFEGNLTAAYLRLYMTETDSGAAYHDSAGGTGMLTLKFSGESALCPDSLGDLSGMAVDLCVRPVSDANYTLAAGDSAGAVHLSYTRDGEHEFWLELVAPIDRVNEGTRTVTFDLSAISVGGDSFQEGTVAGSVTILDVIPFVFDLDHSGSLTFLDFVVMSRVMSAVGAYVSGNGYDDDPGLDFVSQLKLPERTVDLSRTDVNFVFFLNTLGADIRSSVPDKSMRDQTAAWGAQMWEHYFDDMDANGNSTLSFSDFVIMARVVSAILGYIAGNGYDDDPGFDFVSQLEPDNTVDPNRSDADFVFFINAAATDIGRSVPDQSQRYNVVAKVVALMFRAGVLPP